MPPDPCRDCPALATRRTFLGDMGLFLAAAAFRVDLASAVAIHGDDAIYPLPEHDGVTIDRDRAVMLVRWQGFVYAFVQWCPHQHTPVGWQEDLQRFECPKHHSKYEPTGMFIEGRATRGLDRYGIHQDGATVVVALFSVYRQDEDRTGWDAAAIKL